MITQYHVEEGYLEELEVERKEKVYQEALFAIKSAKTEIDYRNVSRQFGSLMGYKASRALTAKYADLADRIAKKSSAETVAPAAESIAPTPEIAVPVIGSTVSFGGYDWRVLASRDSKSLIIAEDVIEQRPYSIDLVDTTWETCALRKYLNGEFLQKLSEEDQGRIAEEKIRNPHNLWYNTQGGRDTSDKIFILSLEEIDSYFGNSGDYQNQRRKKYKNGEFIADNNGWYFSNIYDVSRQVSSSDTVPFWWLRSPGLDSFGAAFVCSNGTVNVDGGLIHGPKGGVRPALWLNM